MTNIGINKFLDDCEARISKLIIERTKKQLAWFDTKDNTVEYYGALKEYAMVEERIGEYQIVLVSFYESLKLTKATASEKKKTSRILFSYFRPYAEGYFNAKK